MTEPLGTMLIRVCPSPNVSHPWCTPSFIFMRMTSSLIEQNSMSSISDVNQSWPLTSDTYHPARHASRIWLVCLEIWHEAVHRYDREWIWRVATNEFFTHADFFRCSLLFLMQIGSCWRVSSTIWLYSCRHSYVYQWWYCRWNDCCTWSILLDSNYISDRCSLKCTRC
jgi:hypothetical protein